MSEPDKSKLKSILQMALFIAGSVLLVYFIIYPSKKDAKESKSVVEVSADQLSSAYTKNESVATEMYNDKILRVTGTIIETGSEAAGQPFVLLQGAGNGQPDIQCIFPGSDVAPMIQSLKRGEAKTFEGSCEGRLSNIILRGCRIQ